MWTLEDKQYTKHNKLNATHSIYMTGYLDKMI